MSSSRPTVFVCYASDDRPAMHELRGHLAQWIPRHIESFVDVLIPAGTAWDPAIQDALLHCDIAVFLASHHFFASEFVKGVEIPALLERWVAGDVDLRVVPLSACMIQEHSFTVGEQTLTLANIQNQHHLVGFDETRAKTLEELDQPIRRKILEAVAHDLACCAVVRERMRALKDRPIAQIRDAWRRAAPEGRPEPTWPKDSQEAVRSALGDLRQTPRGRSVLDLMSSFGEDKAAAPLPGLDVQVIIRPRPDAPDDGWQVEIHGRSAHSESFTVAKDRLDTALHRVGNVIAGIPVENTHIEVIVPLRECELPVDLWRILEGEGEPEDLEEYPAGRRAKLTLRSLERVEPGIHRRALEQRAQASGEAPIGYGLGGPLCRRIKIRIRPDTPPDALAGHAQCAVIDHVPASGKDRRAALKSAFNKGVGTLLWSREPGHGDALAALADPHPPAALASVVLKERIDATEIAEYITLVVDLPPLELPQLTPSSENP